MSFPEVFETGMKPELTMYPTKSEMEKVGLGTSRAERKQYMWTGKTYQHVDDIDYERFINPKTNRPFRFTKEAQAVKEVGSKVVNQVGNVYESKPVQSTLDQTGLNAAGQIFKEGSIAAYNFTKQFVPFKSQIKQGASFALDKSEEALLGISQKVDVHPLFTDIGLTAIEALGPGVAKNIAKKQLVNNLNDLTKFISPSRQVAVAGGVSISNDVKSTILQSVDRTVFKTTSNTYKGLPELAPAYSKAKKTQVNLAKKALEEGKPRPAFWNPKTQSIWKFESKGKGKWSAFNTDNKILRGAKRVNLAKGKYITLDDMVKELGPELGQKAFEINETKLKKLYRWVSKEGAQLDHISPVSRSEGGYLVYTNLILLKAKDNIIKGNKILPKALLDELGVPLSKEAAIRSILKPTSTLTTKQKRVKILRELGIWKEVK